MEEYVNEGVVKLEGYIPDDLSTFRLGTINATASSMLLQL